MAKRSLTTLSGRKVTVYGHLFRPAGAPDIELMAHKVILSIDAAGLPHFGTGFVVTETKTGGLAVSRRMTTRRAAVEVAEERFKMPGAADHVRSKISSL